MNLSVTEHVQVLPQTYKEDQGYRIDDSEPWERSENVIFHSDGSQWHVKVTLLGQIGIATRKSLLKRRKRLEALISIIDFGSLSLLPDTVSELVLERHAVQDLSDAIRLPMKAPGQSESHDSMETVWCYTTREDASKIQYPVYEDQSGVPTMALTDIEEKEQLANNVFLITRKDEGHKCFIYKTVDHPFYEPTLTAVFQQELYNIQLLHGCPNIVQLIAMVKSPSPYQTAPDQRGRDVIHGMVLEYHPHGTLKEAIQQKDGKGSSWKSWPHQLTRALLRLHESSIAHMDITPRNVVIAASNEAVLIDIGVGYTCENVAPEFRDGLCPLDLPFLIKCKNDWWAFGKLLVELASIDENDSFGEILRDTGSRLSSEQPEDRPDIDEAIRQISNYGPIPT